MMKDIVVWVVKIITDITIPELILENQAAACRSTDEILVPPLVFANFMYFLCYHHMNLVPEAQSVLQELSILVQYDYGYHISVRDNAISWQILGICQEICGDHKGAYKSYCNALRQKWCKIKSASFMRILFIIYKRVICTSGTRDYPRAANPLQQNAFKHTSKISS